MTSAKGGRTKRSAVGGSGGRNARTRKGRVLVHTQISHQNPPILFTRGGYFKNRRIVKGVETLDAGEFARHASAVPLEFVVPAGANQMKNYPPGTGFSELPLKLRREASESDAHQLSNRLNNQLDPVFIVAFILMDTKRRDGSYKKSACECEPKREKEDERCSVEPTFSDRTRIRVCVPRRLLKPSWFPGASLPL